MAERFPALLHADDLSFISSNDLLEVQIDDHLPDEESLLQFATKAAVRVAETQGLGRDDFEEKARAIFKDDGPAFQKTFDLVVPKDYEPDLLNSHLEGTQDSGQEHIVVAASAACDNWCRSAQKTTEETGCFFLGLFKG